MRRYFFRVRRTMAVLLCAGLAAASPAFGQVKRGDRFTTFTILHTNDIHGRYLPFRPPPFSSSDASGPAGGFAGLASLVETIRQQRGRETVILVDGGNTFSDDMLGNLTKGEAVIRLMNELGYQFMALGSHDFDYGADRLAQLQAIAQFPLRAANIRDGSTGMPLLGDPAVIITAGGVRVGLLALGFDGSAEPLPARSAEGVRFSDGVRAAQPYVNRLRKNADVVVVISHLGAQQDRALALNVPGIDIIIGARAGDALEKPLAVEESNNRRVWLVRALPDGSLLGDLIVNVANGRITVVMEENELIESGQGEPAQSISGIINDLRAPYRQALEAPVGTASRMLERRYRSSSPFDTLAAQAVRQYTGAELALLPAMDFGVTLASGTVHLEELYALLPHEPGIVTLSLTGAQLCELLEENAARLDPSGGAADGILQGDGLQWSVDLSRPAGARVRIISADGKPFEPKHLYRIATNSEMLADRQRYAVLSEAQDIVVYDESETLTVGATFKKAGTLRPPEYGAATVLAPQPEGENKIVIKGTGAGE